MMNAENSKANMSLLDTSGGRTKSNAIDVPSISLPKGGGALRGIDEKFTVNAVNGTSSFSVPLPFSPARGSASPAMNLMYNSGEGNGSFGLGWILGLPSIKRKTDQGLPKYEDDTDSDTYLFSEAEDLVPAFARSEDGSFRIDANGSYVVHEQDSVDGLFTIRFYKPRIEGLFARIERWTGKSTREIKWRVVSKANVTTLLGWSVDSRICDPQNASRVFEWLPEFVFDDQGNCTHYLYKKEDIAGFDASLLHHRNRIAGNSQLTYANIYIARVCYGNRTPYLGFGDAFPPASDYVFQTVFDYGEYDVDSPYDEIQEWEFRKDAWSEYKAGFEIRTTRRCKRVLLFHHFAELPGGCALVKSIEFGYSEANGTDLSLLKSFTARGYIKKPDGTYTNQSLPPIAFEYQPIEWNQAVQTVSAEALVHAPAGLDEPRYQFTDLYNEGVSGMLTEQGGGWYYKRNLGGGKFGNAELVSRKPSFAGLGSTMRLMDLDADGSNQLVSLANEPKGFFELGEAEDWLPFQPFKSLPNSNMADTNVRMLDLDGDGRSEMLLTEELVFVWYASIGRRGFEYAGKTIRSSDEETGPSAVFSDAEQFIYLADMSGDGLSDIVRIRNGEVCYWPNLGYGRFGAKVAMDNAPVFDHPEAFQPSYLQLADVDGSGTADLLYVGPDRIACWFNLSGNAFSASPYVIEAFPEVHSEARVSVIDLLGNGVACIVWSSPLSKDAQAPLQYIDLMNGRKPHLMTLYKNNLGKEVTMEYKPSTAFYLADRMAGSPWLEPLHFPVHCLTRTETRDRTTGYRFVNEYRYRHGYYDRAEREFRGFGMVEQTDAETFEHWVLGENGQPLDRSMHQAPVVSRSWFHTGVYLNGGDLSRAFGTDYWEAELKRAGFTAENPEIALKETTIVTAPGLDPVLLERLDAEERREAYRACKGRSLRTETFARDAPSNDATADQIRKQLSPYSTAKQGYTIVLMQPKGHNRHAVYAVQEREALTYGYERNTDDPRVAHTLNVKLDEYGQILETASVVYPRRLTDFSLPEETREAQNRMQIVYTLNRYTNDVVTDAAYRLRLPAETKIYELKGLVKAGALFDVLDFEHVLALADEVDYYQTDVAPAPGCSQKRLIEHARTLYRSDDLIDALPIYELVSMALPYESYQLAYTPALVDHIFGDKASDDVLLEGKFMRWEDEPNWWIRSGTTGYIASDETAAEARNRFYLPVSYTDPYGATTKVKYDRYRLFMTETEDALGNRAKVEWFNFRTLSPQRMRDANHNLSETLTDELGLVKAMAVYGKGSEADDLSGFNEFSSTSERVLINVFLHAQASDVLVSHGKSLLRHATARFVYDYDAYRKSGKPAAAASIVREEHYIDNVNSPVQISFEYSNGLGQVVMKKTQAEPGPAKQVTVNPDDSYAIVDIDTAALSPQQLRWIGNGRTVLNNKGNPVKQYEPYFSVTHRYEDLKELVETGVTPLSFYDAPGRLIRTELPDGTLTRATFDSWKQAAYDANDTILESSWYFNRTNRLIDNELLAAGKDPVKEKEAADQSAAHANTPSVQHLDSLGRPVLAIDHNRAPDTGKDEFVATRVVLDIESNLKAVIDARGNLAMEYRYDMLGNKVYQRSMDAGSRWQLTNITGQPLRTWDRRNHEMRYFYDILQRPTHSMVSGGDGAIALNHVVERMEYGDGEDNPEAKNLRGRVIRHYDTGGRTETPEFDFKGQPMSMTRTLYRNYKEIANWIYANPEDDLEEESFTIRTVTDAIGRIVRQIVPDGRILVPVYNKAGLLKGEKVIHTDGNATESYINDINYNEKGQRTSVVYGNGVLTRFHYDRETLRPTRLETKRGNGEPLQDWRYTYDPTGNITHIQDNNVPVVFFDNRKIVGVATFTYDSLYRLIQATGRENEAALPDHGGEDNWNDNAFMHSLNPGDPMAMRMYIQSYRYDLAGNLLQMRHQAAGSNWTRDYEMASANNRLLRTQVGSATFHYTHHSQHGYITSMPHLSYVGWNYKEELAKTVRQRRTDGGTPETTYYQYDGEGQRIRKITEYQAPEGQEPTRKDERIYIAGYEIYRRYAGADAGLERTSLSLMDGGHRFVLIDVETKPAEGFGSSAARTAPVVSVRYLLHNHLGSASLELDEEARVVSYEEYHPFGTTAYKAHNASIRSAAKRYRYTGMERDEESGLAYHGARYYLPWLGRWLNCDPAGMVEGTNLYAYCRNSPVIRHDRNGRQSATEDTKPEIFFTADQIQRAARFGSKMSKQERKDRMYPLLEKYGIPKEGFADEISNLYDKDKDVRLVGLLRVLSREAYKKEKQKPSEYAAINVNRAANIVKEISPLLSMMIAAREHVSSITASGEEKKVNTFAEGGIDHLSTNMGKFRLVSKITSNWTVLSSQDNPETSKKVYPAEIPTQDEVLAYAAQTRHSYEQFEVQVKDRLGERGGDRALNQLSYEARQVWQSYAFLAPGGAVYNPSAKSQHGQNYGVKTALGYLIHKAETSGSEVDLNTILTDTDFNLTDYVKIAKVRAVEADFMEDLIIDANSLDRNLTLELELFK
ncbi:SpvB/TcaC N-terminal domain-containing protein [Cohnella herbarum]|uniref:Insecticidal toxin complex protein n=1 Tax=Cohnella herbarum TaxID=2728023 RepID=A0A7Z2ZKL6_9BACL|nr:SpvB/TcaC N-terminal domain-containing protein [Cohnella herbarum]QJD82970.1 insecticidal toxin complex protein [Cohnella herbarum]